jgi:hypothetical protein
VTEKAAAFTTSREFAMKFHLNRLLPSAAAVLAAIAGLSQVAVAAPLTAGDLFIYRVGTGAASLTSAATAVFVDEYTTTGAFVQSIALPTALAGAQGYLTASGTASSEGLLTFSTNNQYLMLTGYDAAVGTASIAGTASATTPRTVGRIALNGLTDTSTQLNNFSGNNIRGVASSNGTDIWTSGANSGVIYTTLGSTGAGTAVSTTVTNLRSLEIFNGQLYASSGSGTVSHLGAIGSGLPTTTGQLNTSLSGFPTTGSQYAFFFADLSSSVAGVDTLYVADDTAASGGITKYSLVGGSWVSSGLVGTGADSYRGLTGTVSAAGAVTLFATGLGGTGATGGGKLVSFSDASGYNGAFSGTATLLATAASNTAFRGVAYLSAITAIPEPGTYAMLIAGLAAVGFVARRERG